MNPPASDVEEQLQRRARDVANALSYLDDVKTAFKDQPEAYDRFLEIIQDWKRELLDARGVTARVVELFSGHPALVRGFDAFLPGGDRVDRSSVVAPAGTAPLLASDEGVSTLPHALSKL